MTTRTKPMPLPVIEISMDRRGFIQVFIGAAALVVAPQERRPGLREARILGSDQAHGLHLDKPPGPGFGLATAKMEGATIPYDQGPYVAEVGPRILKSAGVTMKKAEFSQEIADGFEKAFGDHYEKPEDWPETWNDE